MAVTCTIKCLAVAYIKIAPIVIVNDHLCNPEVDRDRNMAVVTVTDPARSSQLHDEHHTRATTAHDHH